MEHQTNNEEDGMDECMSLGVRLNVHKYSRSVIGIVPSDRGEGVITDNVGSFMTYTSSFSGPHL